MATSWIDRTFAQAFADNQAGKLREAESACRQILAQSPNHADTLQLFGVVWFRLGNPQIGIESIRRAISLKPNDPNFHANLAMVLAGAGQPDEAIESFHEALRIRPDFFPAMPYLANLLKSRGRIDEALAMYLRAIQINPNVAELHSDFGTALLTSGRFEKAAEAFGQAIKLKPGQPQMYNNLGIAQKGLDQIEEARQSFERAIELDPNAPDAHANLGNILNHMGRVDLAIDSYKRALALKPNWSKAQSNMLFALHYSSDYDAKMLFEEHRKWGELVEGSVAATPRVARPESNAKIKLGYVSADFREHVVGWNLLPLLEQHDPEKFEIYCYSSVLQTDSMTEKLKGHVDVWRNIVGLTDDAAADMIRADGIDVLVDLALHTAHNRLSIFARKPAPVQLTYLGYCSTTGLKSMGFRLSDPYLDPPETDLSVYTEETIRLPRTYWCYRPGGSTPEVKPPPAQSNGFVTFGSMNKFAKVSPAAMDLWVKILSAVPNSRLLVHARSEKYLDPLIEKLAAAGVEKNRVEYVPNQKWDVYIDTYNRIDIALDPFPFNGGITSCDALFMGVPVVTLSGRTAVGRGGRSILSNIGLPELVANSPDEYLKIAKDLANDLPRLSDLRASLRTCVEKSPLMDAKQFARDIEAVVARLARAK